MIVFEYPLYFTALLCIPLYVVLRLAGVIGKTSFPLVLGDWNGRSFVYTNTAAKLARFLSAAIFAAAYSMLVTAAAGPVISHPEKVYTSRGAEIMFVVDCSPSMAAADMDGKTRLDAAKKAAELLTREFPGSSFGLTAMASEAAAIVPPTLDRRFFYERLAHLRIGELGQGTALGAGISTAVFHLALSPSPAKSIVVLTDGENNAGSIHPSTAVSLAADNDIAVYIGGIGMRGEVSISYTDIETGKVIAGTLDSSFDEDALRSLAREGDGYYFSAEDTAGLVSSLSSIAKKESAVQTYYFKSVETRYYAHFLAAALLLFAAAWFIRRIYMKEYV